MFVSSERIGRKRSLGDTLHALDLLVASLQMCLCLSKSNCDYPQSRTSYQCPNEVKSQVMSVIRKTLAEDRDTKQVWTYDGVRVNYDDGSWILVRPSGTEPKIRAYCEARSQARLDELVKRASTLVAKSTRIR